MRPLIIYTASTFCIYINISFEQTLPEGPPDRTTVCHGVSLLGSCPSVESIAVKNIQYGTKTTATCALSDTSAGCCDYNVADCALDYTDTPQFIHCSGKEVCSAVTIGQTDTSTCGASYPGLNHYLTMEYYCIPDARIGSFCSAVAETVTGAAFYLQNTDYPNPIRSEETHCECSIEATSCSAQITVYLVHVQLSDGSDTCTDTQKLQIYEDGTNNTLTCSQNTKYTITLQMTSSSNYVKTALINTAATNDGYIWIGFKATEDAASLKITCPSANQAMCIDCSSLSNPSHGTVSLPAGLAYTSQATYSCDNGYDLTGGPTRTCQANGTWSSSEPFCQPVECPALTNPNHGTVSLLEGRTYTQQATYACSSGYALNGSATATCQADQTWSNSPPTCEASSSQSTGSGSIDSGSSGTGSSGSSSNQNADDPGNGGPSAGTVVGIVIGVLAAIACSVIAILGLLYWHNRSEDGIKGEKEQDTRNILPVDTSKTDTEKIPASLTVENGQLPETGQPPLQGDFRPQSGTTSGIVSNYESSATGRALTPLE